MSGTRNKAHCASLLLSLGYKVRAKVWSSYSSRGGLYIPYHNIVNLDSVNYYTKKTEAGLWNEDGCVKEQWSL